MVTVIVKLSPLSESLFDISKFLLPRGVNTHLIICCTFALRVLLVINLASTHTEGFLDHGLIVVIFFTASVHPATGGTLLARSVLLTGGVLACSHVLAGSTSGCHSADRLLKLLDVLELVVGFALLTILLLKFVLLVIIFLGKSGILRV